METNTTPNKEDSKTEILFVAILTFANQNTSVCAAKSAEGCLHRRNFFHYCLKNPVLLNLYLIHSVQV